MLLKSRIRPIFVFLVAFFGVTLLVYIFSTNGYSSKLNRQSIRVLSHSVHLERIEHLNKVCHLYNLTNQGFDTLWKNKDVLDHIMVDREHHLLYCYVPKVACTNWKRVLMVLSGRSGNWSDAGSIPASVAHAHSSLPTLGDYPRPQAEAFLKSFTKFLFVRHPFERLLSAFRNKLERNLVRSKYFQDRVGKLIVKKYRRRGKGVGGSSLRPLGKGGPSPSSPSEGDDVTFEEFTAYLTKSPPDTYNEHWKPVETLCSPCTVGYDFIGKYETLLADSEFFLRDVVGVGGGGARGVKFPAGPRGSATSRDLKKYFSGLSSARIKALYDVYQRDFKLFSYDLGQLLGYEVT